jgi:hypothetical protein
LKASLDGKMIEANWIGEPLVREKRRFVGKPSQPMKNLCTLESKGRYPPYRGANGQLTITGRVGN